MTIFNHMSELPRECTDFELEEMKLNRGLSFSLRARAVNELKRRKRKDFYAKFGVENSTLAQPPRALPNTKAKSRYAGIEKKRSLVKGSAVNTFGRVEEYTITRESSAGRKRPSRKVKHQRKMVVKRVHLKGTIGTWSEQWPSTNT